MSIRLRSSRRSYGMKEGLDQAVLDLGKLLDQALHGDFGKSYSTRKTAFVEVKVYFPQTFKWQLLRFLLLMIVSILSGFCRTIYET